MFGGEPLGFGERQGDGQREVRAAVCKALRPEFINRLDGVVPFLPLSEQDLGKIAALLLQELQQRLAQQGINARFSADVASEVLRRGQDRRYGARAIRRCIEQQIGSVLAQKIMAGELPEGELTAAMLFGIPVSMG